MLGSILIISVIIILILMFSCLVVSNSLRPHAWQPTRLLCPWGFSRQEYWSGLPCLPSGDLPDPGMEPRSPALQVDSLPSEPPGKPKKTGVGSLSLLQGIFSTQGSNPSLPHCRLILYQLSHPSAPSKKPGVLQQRFSQIAIVK